MLIISTPARVRFVEDHNDPIGACAEVEIRTRLHSTGWVTIREGHFYEDGNSCCSTLGGKRSKRGDIPATEAGVSGRERGRKMGPATWHPEVYFYLAILPSGTQISTKKTLYPKISHSPTCAALCNPASFFGNSGTNLGEICARHFCSNYDTVGSEKWGGQLLGCRGDWQMGGFLGSSERNIFIVGVTSLRGMKLWINGVDFLNGMYFWTQYFFENMCSFRSFLQYRFVYLMTHLWISW